MRDARGGISRTIVLLAALAALAPMAGLGARPDPAFTIQLGPDEVGYHRVREGGREPVVEMRPRHDRSARDDPFVEQRGGVVGRTINTARTAPSACSGAPTVATTCDRAQFRLPANCRWA